MDELEYRSKFIITYPLLDEVLDGLDIMIGRPLDLLHTLSVLDRKVFVESSQSATILIITDLLQLRKNLGETDKILDLDANAISDQSCLGEVITQFLYFVAIATIDRRDGCQWIQRHMIVIGLVAQMYPFLPIFPS